MERIVTDPKIMHGKPVIKGTRVPVEVILGSLVGGMKYEEIDVNDMANSITVLELERYRIKKL